jgi:short-subunit dehydrogenase
MKIKNKVTIVTGASQGIGEATAKHLAHLGAQVVLAARSKEKIEKLSQELQGTLAVVTDMRENGDIRKLVEKTLKKYGRIDILINNAGQGMQGPVEKIDVKQYKDLMGLNVYGVLEAMQAVIPVMRRQGGGMILNVSSGVTKMYIPGIAAYSSTKYALNALSLIARQELAKDKIIVSMVHPGMTATNFYQNMIGGAPDFSGRDLPPMDSPEKVAKKIAELIGSESAELEV